LVTLSVGLPVTCAGENVGATLFKRSDGKLGLEEAAAFIAYRKGKALSDLVPANGVRLVITRDLHGVLTTNVVISATNLVASLADELAELQEDIAKATGRKRPPPWTPAEVDAVYADVKDDTPKWKQIKGLTVQKTVGAGPKAWNLGPFRLRKNEDEILKDKVTDAKGATIGFADNHFVEGHGAWNSEGVLYYPVSKKLWDAKPIGSAALELGPAANWNLAEVEGSAGNDVQELGFSLPTTLKWVPGGTGSAARLLWQGKPYFNTDFSFEHEIYGIETSVEFVGNLGTPYVHLGGYQNLAGKAWIQYQLRVIPKLDYSETAQGGEHTSRQEEDDWLRVGATLSLDFRLAGKGFKTLGFGTSYELLDTLSGSGGYSDLFKAHATWWLIDNAGLTFEYSDGETPVAAERISRITLGLELKF